MDRQYEEAYRNALEVLRLRAKTIDRPHRGKDGFRYCRIDGQLLSDRGVFREAWDDSLADEILDEHKGNQSLEGCCSEVDRTWDEYFIAAGQYSTITPSTK